MARDLFLIAAAFVASLSGGCVADEDMTMDCDEACDEATQTPRVTGHLVDAYGNPIPYASLKVQGPRNIIGISPNRDGEFSVLGEHLPRGFYTLRFSQGGDTPPNCNFEKNFRLKDEPMDLGEIEVPCGYGSPYVEEPKEPPYAMTVHFECEDATTAYMLSPRKIFEEMEEGRTFATDDLAPGLYMVRARGWDWRKDFLVSVADADADVSISCRD